MRDIQTHAAFFVNQKRFTINTAIHATVADKNRFEVNHATAPAKNNAKMPLNGFWDMVNIAGTVITDNVT